MASRDPGAPYGRWIEWLIEQPLDIELGRALRTSRSKTSGKKEREMTMHQAVQRAAKALGTYPNSLYMLRWPNLADVLDELNLLEKIAWKDGLHPARDNYEVTGGQLASMQTR